MRSTLLTIAALLVPVLGVASCSSFGAAMTTGGVPSDSGTSGGGDGSSDGGKGIYPVFAVHASPDLYALRLCLGDGKVFSGIPQPSDVERPMVDSNYSGLAPGQATAISISPTDRGTTRSVYAIRAKRLAASSSSCASLICEGASCLDKNLDYVDLGKVAIPATAGAALRIDGCLPKALSSRTDTKGCGAAYNDTSGNLKASMTEVSPSNAFAIGLLYAQTTREFSAARFVLAIGTQQVGVTLPTEPNIVHEFGAGSGITLPNSLADYARSGVALTVMSATAPDAGTDGGTPPEAGTADGGLSDASTSQEFLFSLPSIHEASDPFHELDRFYTLDATYVFLVFGSTELGLATRSDGTQDPNARQGSLRVVALPFMEQITTDR